MDIHLTRDPKAICELLTSGAEIELGCLRRLAAELPQVADFEKFCDLGLEIGRCGRRLRIILEAAEIDTDHTVPQWDEAFQSADLSGWSQIALSWLSDSNLATYRARLALSSCTTPPFSPTSTQGSSSIVSKILDSLVATRRRRSSSGPRIHRRRRITDTARIDPRWRLAAPGQSMARMRRIETLEGLRHKMHHTAFRETVAAEIPAMNLYEYDGLPWRFYLDMADHLEDEVRHAHLCLETLLELGGSPGDFWLPCFGNFYSMFWEMNLEERLVSLNLDTEGLGYICLTRAVRRLERSPLHSFAHIFRFLAEDERRHAAIGARWFSYLVSPSERQARLVAARALALINLASAQTTVTGGTVTETIRAWEQTGIPIRYSEVMGPEHESEVSLASRKDRFLEGRDRAH